MSLIKIAKLLKSKNCKFIFTKHAMLRIKERDLDENKISYLISSSEIKGIVNQENLVYKIWVIKDKKYDLNLIIRVDFKNKNLYIISTFLCDKFKRIKKKK